jgi:hypothetical protein
MPGLLAALPGSPPFEGGMERVEWIRTYWDEESRRGLGLYAVPDDESAHALRRVLDRSGAVVHEVTEVHPELYSAG